LIFIILLVVGCSNSDIKSDDEENNLDSCEYNKAYYNNMAHQYLDLSLKNFMTRNDPVCNLTAIRKNENVMKTKDFLISCYKSEQLGFNPGICDDGQTHCEFLEYLLNDFTINSFGPTGSSLLITDSEKKVFINISTEMNKFVHYGMYVVPINEESQKLIITHAVSPPCKEDVIKSAIESGQVVDFTDENKI